MLKWSQYFEQCLLKSNKICVSLLQDSMKSDLYHYVVEMLLSYSEKLG
jgi:hypothetical protein